MINSFRIVGNRVEIDVPQKKTGEVFTFTINKKDLAVIQEKNSWGMDKNNTSAVANYRDDGKMKKITMHKLLTGWKNTEFKDGDRFNLRRDNLVQSDKKSRRRASGVNLKGNSYEVCEDHAKIFITNSMHSGVVLVDISDLEKVLQYTWNINPKHGYVQTRTREGRQKAKTLLLHRLILGDECDGQYVDHLSMNKLDNRRSNLRVCSNSENLHNNPMANRNNLSTGVRGVSKMSRDGSYYAQMKIKGKHLRRRFSTFEEAKAQRLAWEKEYGVYPIDHE